MKRLLEVCAGCDEALGNPWGQCNATPDVSYHRECCPGCHVHVDSEAAPYAMRYDAHGTINGYSNYRCRCPKCVEAERRYRADLVARGGGYLPVRVGR